MEHEHDPKHPEQSIDTTRRRLAKAGLAAPAVLGVLASRPVLGAPPYQCTISGMVSGNLSRPQGTPDACGKLGKSPGYWKNHTDQWPSVDPNAYFNTVFADAYCYQIKNRNTIELAAAWQCPIGYSPNPTLLQVLQAADGMSSPPYPSLGRAAVASYLNAIVQAPDYPLTPQRVVAMFNAVYRGGTYNVAPGVDWDANQVKSYFESLYNG